MGPCSRAPLTLEDLRRKFAALSESVSISCAENIQAREKAAQELREIKKQLSNMRVQLAALRREAPVDDLIASIQQPQALADVDVIKNRCE